MTDDKGTENDDAQVKKPIYVKYDGTNEGAVADAVLTHLGIPLDKRQGR
jgi:hypothetical protein